jgi:hypothetical protein
MSNLEPTQATEADKARLVAEALRHFKASGAAKDRTQWFFEVLVEAAGVETVRVALRVFDPDFVIKKDNRGRKPRFRPGVLERQIARRFAVYQAARPGKSIKVLYPGFVATLPPHLRPSARQSWKTTANDIATGNRLNQRRPLLLRLAEEMKRQHGLFGPNKRDIVQRIRTLARTASDDELRDKMTKAQYLRACGEAALMRPGLLLEK